MSDIEQPDSVGAKESQNDIKLVVDLGDRGAMEIPLTGKLVVDLQQNSDADSTVNSIGTKDSQNNVKLVVDIGDKETMEIPLTGKLVMDQQQKSGSSPRDAEDTDQMRGWMMTVATLFVTLAYEAVMQPPRWMPNGDWLKVENDSYKQHYGTTTTGASSSSSSSHADRLAMPAPSPSPPAMTVRQARLARWYVHINTLTFGMALALVVILALMTKNTPPMDTKLVKYFVLVLACSVATTFVLGNSDEPSILKFVCCYTVINAVATAWYVTGVGQRWWSSIREKICACASLAKRKFSSTRG